LYFWGNFEGKNIFFLKTTTGDQIGLFLPVGLLFEDFLSFTEKMKQPKKAMSDCQYNDNQHNNIQRKNK
jgi:hypothetical protein